MEKEEETKTNRGATLDVRPLGKWRRVLLFLGDFFIAFILSIFLSNIIAFPIAKAATDYDARQDENIAYQQDRFQILYDDGLLYYENAETRNNLEENLSYTYDLFLSYYVTGSSLEYEVFSTYYSKFAPEGESLQKVYEKYDSLAMFDFSAFDENRLPTMKEETRQLLAPYFDQADEMNEEGQQLYDSAFSHFFLSVFYAMVDSIEANDLSSIDGVPSRSYNELNVLIEQYADYYNTLAIACAASSYALSCIILFFVYPQLNKNGRTPSQSILKADRVDRSSFRLPNRPIRLLVGLYQSALCLPFILFVPIPTVSINYVFALSPLFALMVVGAALLLAALIAVIIDRYNRGVSELFTHSVMLKEETLDEVYKAKGYYV